MALRTIILEGDPLLTKVCNTVEVFDEKLALLLDDMNDTMKNANGVGLAAPQIGILKRIAIVNVGDGLIEMVNPKIVSSEGIQKKYEGCLSCPNAKGITERPLMVTVKAKNRFGEEMQYFGKDLKARAFCHEIDHLDGILFKSRLVSV